jgi:hypothetical protein
MKYVPHIARSDVVAVHVMGDYEAQLHTDLVSLGEVGYDFMLVVLGSAERPVLFVTAETIPLYGTRALGVFSEWGHHSHEWSPAWAKREAFEEKALSTAKEWLNLSGDWQRASGSRRPWRYSGQAGAPAAHHPDPAPSAASKPPGLAAQESEPDPPPAAGAPPSEPAQPVALSSAPPAWLVCLVYALAFALGAYLWLALVTPTSASSYGSSTFVRIWLYAVVAVIGGVIVVGILWTNGATLRTHLIVAVLALMGLGIWGLTLRDDHRDFNQARAVFDRYTEHFPSGRLGHRVITQHYTRAVTMCADERVASGRPGQAFCLEMDLFRPRGEEVQGGYRYRYDDQDPDINYHGFPESPFDCFGYTAGCGTDDEPPIAY